MVDADGQPRREDAAAAVRGVWYVGLRWLIRRGSSILLGFPGDAATVADAVKTHLDNRPLRCSHHGVANRRKDRRADDRTAASASPSGVPRPAGQPRWLV